MVDGDPDVVCNAFELMFVPVDQGPGVSSSHVADGSGFFDSSVINSIDFSPSTFASFQISHLTRCDAGQGEAGTCNFQNSFVDYRFSQTRTTTTPPTGMPEPATLTLFGIGLVGLAFTRWRTRKTA